MPNRIFVISLLATLGLWSVAAPVFGQALLPATLQLNADQLEQDGLTLAEEAAQLARFEQYELALQRAYLGTQLAPQKPQTWAVLGSLYLQIEKWNEGITALEQALNLDPNNAAILFALGAAHFQQENYSEAIAQLQAGLKIKPDTIGALFDLGNAYFKLQQFNQAINYYQQAITLDAKFWPAINNIGLIEYEQGDIEAALRSWRSALAVDAEAAEPKLAMAVALYAQGDREQGLAMGEAALRSDHRYGDVDFLKENLWGDRLIADTQTFLSIPRIRDTIAQAQAQPLPTPVSP